MAAWKKQLDDFYSLVRETVQKREKGSGQLRFDCHLIKASDVAQQFFCEKKVEMQYVHGKIETEEKILGTEAHQKLLEDTRTIKRKKLWKKIYGKTPIFAHEMFLLAKYQDVVLAGMPDSVLFANGIPAIVFEYKFSRSGRIFDSYQVQTRTYGILLKGMGFDTSRLFCAIVVAEPRVRDDVELKHRVVDAVVKNGPKEAVLNVDGAKIFFERFDGTKAEQDLDWAVAFWRKEREAIPTDNPNKCIRCEYSTECRQSVP